MADETVDIRYLLNSDEFARESARIDAAIRGTERTTESTVSQMDSEFKRLAKTAGQIGIATALAAAGREVFNFAREFESKMSEVITLSDEIETNIDDYKAKVIALTRSIPVMATESAAALYQIVSAGHDGADGMTILEQSAKAAVAGVTETATAADGITSILNAYQKSASEAESVSDMMFTTVRLGKTTFGELASYIAQVTPTAAAYGVEMDQVLAAIATLTKSGVPTAQAVTQIRQAIIAASKVLGDGAFEGRSLQEALGMIADKAGGSESKLRALVPEIEAVNGMLGLTGINARTASEHLDAMTQSAGATAKAFEQQMRDPQKQIELLKNNLLAAFSDLGEGALNTVGELAQLLNEAFSSGAADKLIGVIATLTVAYGTYRTQLLLVAAAKRLLENNRYDEEGRQLAVLLSKEQQRALGITNLNRLTREQTTAVREKVAAEVQALRTAAQLAAAEKAAATEGYRSALQRALASKEAVRNAESALVAAQASGDAERIAAAQSALAAAQEERHAAAVARKAAAQTYASARTKAATTATAANTLQTRVATATDTAAAKAKNLFTVATTRLTRAFQAMKVAFAANPIGAIITVVTTAATAMSLFGDNTEEAAGGVSAMSDALAKHQAEINRETAKIDELFAAIRKAKTGTQEYADAKDAILRGYGSYLSGLGEEIRQLQDVEGAYIAIKTAAQESAAARAKAAFVEDAEGRAAGTMGQAISGLRAGLEKKLSDKYLTQPGLVDRIVAQMTEIMSRPGKSAATAKYDISKILREYGIDWTGLADISEHGFMWQDNYIDDYVEAFQSLEQVRKTADDVFGNGGKGGGETEQIKTVAERVTELRTEIAKAESELQKLRASGSTATDSQITAAENRLKELRSQLEIYTGVSSKDATDALKKQRELSQAATQAEIDAQSQRIALMRDGKNKRLAEIDLEYKQEVAKINQNRQRDVGNGVNVDYDGQIATAEQKRVQERAQVEKEYAMQTAETYRQLGDVFLSEEERKQRATERTYQAMRDKAVEDLQAGNISGADFVSMNDKIDRAEEQETAQNQLEKWQKYATERLRIEEEFQQDVARIRKQGRGQEGEDEIEQLRTIRDNDIATLTESMGMKDEEFTAIVDNIVNMGLEKILEMIPQVQAAISALGDSDLTQKAKLQATENALKTAKSKQSGNTSQDTAPGSKTINEWKDLQSVLNDVYDTFGEVGDAIGGTAGTAIKTGGEIATAMTQLIDGIVMVATGSVTAVQGSSQAASNAIKTVETASVILAIISAALQVATKIASLFTKDHELSQETIKSYEAYIDVLDQIIEREKDVIESHTGMQAVLASDDAVKAIEKQEEATRKLGKAYLASRAKNSHSYGVKTAERLGGYRDAIEAAGFDWAELYGSGRMEGLFDLSGAEIERFQTELPEVWAKLDEETQGYLQTLVDCKNQMEEIGEVTNEALTGFSFDDAKDELEDFLNDMDMTFEDVADNFQSRMMTAINRVVASGLEGRLQSWYDHLSEAMEDGTLTDAEREALRQEYEEIYRKAKEEQDAAYTAAGINPSIGSSDGLRGEISEKITEETASKLEGLFRVTYDKVAAIHSNSSDQLNTLRAGFSDVAEMLRTQVAIEENTRRSADNSDRITEQLNDLKDELKAIKTNTKGGVYGK